jgi:hypothetical protein
MTGALHVLVGSNRERPVLLLARSIEFVRVQIVQGRQDLSANCAAFFFSLQNLLGRVETDDMVSRLLQVILDDERLTPKPNQRWVVA